MVSDNEILQRARKWYSQNYQNYRDMNTLLLQNEELVNLPNYFEENSLELDSNVDMRISASEFFKYSGLSSEDKDEFKSENSTALLLQSGSVERFNISISGEFNEGLKLENNYLYPDQGLNDEKIILYKIHSSDSGILRNSNNSKDVPYRKILESSNNITFMQKDLDSSSSFKKLFIEGFSNESNYLANNLINFLNLMTNTDSLRDSIVYHGECRFFNLDFINSGYTVNSICNGNFRYDSSSGELRSVNIIEDSTVSLKFIPIINSSSGNTVRWKLQYNIGSNSGEIDFRSVNKFNQQITGNNNLKNLPLPIRTDYSNCNDDTVHWESSYLPANISDLCISKFVLILKSENESVNREIDVFEWGINYNTNTDKLEIIISTDLVDTENNQLNLSNNYLLINVNIVGSVSTDPLNIPIQSVPVDRDPFEFKLNLELFN